MTAFRWLCKNYKNLSFIFIVMGFINVWVYFKWIGRVDFFPLIIGNLSGSLSILISSLVFFLSISIMFFIPSALCSLMGLKSTVKDKKKLSIRERLKVEYNEGCTALTALITILTALAVLLMNDKVSVGLFVIPVMMGLITHVVCNYFINNKRQKYLRLFISRLRDMHVRKKPVSNDVNKWFAWERFKADPITINIFYCSMSLCVAFISILPLFILIDSEVYFTGERLLVQYSIVLILYVLLFMPALMMLFKNKAGRAPSINPSFVLAPFILIVIFGVFPALLIQINHRGIELVGMASWKPKVFSFNADDFPAYYFPEKEWGITRQVGKFRLVKGLQIFSNGNVWLICPSGLQKLRTKALQKNALIWKVDEGSKYSLRELSQYCLIARDNQVRTEAALKVLYESMLR
ncbi:hypothetical protein [Pantoea agglomerans]|uniref:hypothetical protein n=1 Tax=Enterobacter agglomerans TaxID=549 RepID=UPI002413A4C6|nr:hypothetical protein [Pantoea agglomerans]